MELKRHAGLTEWYDAGLGPARVDAYVMQRELAALTMRRAHAPQEMQDGRFAIVS